MRNADSTALEDLSYLYTREMMTALEEMSCLYTREVVTALEDMSCLYTREVVTVLEDMSCMYTREMLTVPEDMSCLYTKGSGDSAGRHVLPVYKRSVDSKTCHACILREVVTVLEDMS